MIDSMHRTARYHGSTGLARSFEDLLLVETEHRERQSVPVHAHDAATLCLPLAGAFEEVAGRARLAVASPSVVARAAGEPHADEFGPRTARCFNVVLGRAWLARHGVERAPWSGVELLRPEAASLTRRLHCELRGDASPLVLQGVLLTLLGEAERGTPAMRGRPPAWLARVEAFLRDAGPGRIDLVEVAAAAGVHPAHVAREFRRHRRLTIGEHVRRLRIEQACGWLESDGRTLAEIAAAAGFADQSHFGRVFRRIIGVTPGQYRRARKPGSRRSRAS